MLSDILFIIWFFLPLGVANSTPIAMAKIPYLRDWRTPIDGGQTYRGKRILGDNKTWRGLITGITAGTLTSVALHTIYLNYSDIFSPIMPIAYESINPWIFGILSSIGALLGDAVESFAKRQLDIPSGSTWFPFDQLDYIIGGILLTYWYVPLSLYFYILALCVAFLAHLVASYIGYSIGIKEKPI